MIYYVSVIIEGGEMFFFYHNTLGFNGQIGKFLNHPVGKYLGIHRVKAGW